MVVVAMVYDVGTGIREVAYKETNSNILIGKTNVLTGVEIDYGKL